MISEANNIQQNCLIYSFKLALHVSDDRFAHLREHFDLYTVFGTIYRLCCLLPIGDTDRVVADIIALAMHGHTNVKLVFKFTDVDLPPLSVRELGNELKLLETVFSVLYSWQPILPLG